MGKGACWSLHSRTGSWDAACRHCISPAHSLTQHQWDGRLRPDGACAGPSAWPHLQGVGLKLGSAGLAWFDGRCQRTCPVVHQVYQVALPLCFVHVVVSCMHTRACSTQAVFLCMGCWLDVPLGWWAISQPLTCCILSVLYPGRATVSVLGPVALSG